MKSIGIVIDIKHLIRKNQIRRLIREQLQQLGIENYMAEDCVVSFNKGKPQYTGFIWDIYTGEQVQLNPEFSVVKALVNL
jgi:RNase P protein component|tara:strand:+ start:1390 stop:1629 length:240 start_codon:yes stop_codon:yes gene_type:complete